MSRAIWVRSSSGLLNFFSSRRRFQNRTSIRFGFVVISKSSKCVSTLSADELANLAARTRKIQNDFAAGALNNEQLTYIVIAIGTALLVILILAL